MAQSLRPSDGRDGMGGVLNEFRRARTLRRSCAPAASDAGCYFAFCSSNYQESNREPTISTIERTTSGVDRAVQSDDLAGLDFLLTRAVKQDAIGRFPGLGPDGADRLVQHRLLRGPRQRQPREGAERGGVFKMKRQLLIAQLAMPLEKPAAQDRLCRQTLSPGLRNPTPAQILCY